MSNLAGLINRLVRRIERLEAGANLESSSITNGRMRFIGGLLRVDSGGRVEIVGTLQIDGTTAINGSTTVNGTFKIEGPWSLNGNGEIAGNVTVTGKLTQNGQWEFIGAGKISGNVEVTGDFSVVGGGRIRAGQIVLNPSTNGGRIEIGAHTIYVSGDVLSINHSAGHQVVLNNGGVNLIGGGKILGLGSTGFRIVGLPKVTKAGIPSGCVYKGSDGFLYEG
ncbi:hypothetical protein [Microbacterium galbinum]|uniref:Polymer-forming cytoskeletal protein n=1 Tax=Microbacterium galbinum TaxID=2851646 RepID=A0ABY4IJT3_9MICO|nr:hypothetical protein [Microbacterium galbinum]UPL13008.1 hypothetical protein KV396_00220 [Microbacterium galbinum]